MPEQPTSDATPDALATPDTPARPDAASTPEAPAASSVPAEPTAPAASSVPAEPTVPAGPAVPTQPAQPVQPAEAPKTSDAGSKRKKILSALGTVALLLVAKFGLAALFADDPTHGVAVGQCVAADGSDDFKQVDCGSSDSLGKVTFVAKDAETTEKAALDLCAQHGADSAYTAADSSGGKGTVVCVSGT